MKWLYSLLGKLGHVNGNVVHRDIAETKTKLATACNEISGLKTQLAALGDDTSTIKNDMSALTAAIARVTSLETQDVVDRFHMLYYGTKERTWENTYWLGTPVQKYPTDLWIYQEILSEIRPDVIVECGTLHGGSALYLASICDLLNHGRVITIDVQAQTHRPNHPRITYLIGSSVEGSIVQRVRTEIHPGDRVLVVLDSDHHQPHVVTELVTYAPLVTAGSYMIVEDTNINGHPVYPDFGPGPMEAVQEFLKCHPEFVADASRHKFYVTANPAGYLKKMP